MTQFDKLIQKILSGSKNVTFSDAEKVLNNLEFQVKVTGSHYNFRKKGYEKTITLKYTKLLLPYQVNLLKEVLKDHGY